MMTKKIMKPLLGAVGVTALSFGTMLGFTAPAFADAVAPVVTVTGPNCNSSLPRTLLATLAPGQVLQGSVMTTGTATGRFTRITDTNGFSEDFPSATPTLFTIDNTSNTTDTVSACIFPDSTTGVVTLQTSENENGNENGNENNRRITFTINNTPTAKVDDSGNSHNDIDNENTIKKEKEKEKEDKYQRYDDTSSSDNADD